MKEFKLNGEEYIELNKLLKIMRFVGSGGEANMVIVNEEVLVNNEIETQKRKKIRVGDLVSFNGKEVKIK
jgi:ribosome-associated protein